MMLLLTVFYNIPEFDISHFFLMSCSSGKLNGVGNMTTLNNSSAAENPQIVTNESDPERMRLQPSGSQGPKYTQQINETNELGVRILLFGTFFEKVPIFYLRLQFQNTRTFVRARSRPDDDSPNEEAPAPGPSGRTRLR